MLEILDVLVPPGDPQGVTKDGTNSYIILGVSVVVAIAIAICLYKLFGIKRVKIASSKKTTKKK